MRFIPHPFPSKPSEKMEAACGRLISHRKGFFSMGFVYAEITVAGKNRKSLRALVDTGATYLVLSPQTVRELELTPAPYKVGLTLADKRRIEAPLYVAEVEGEGRKGPVLVAEVDAPTPLLGVFALEALGLKPDPSTGKLEVVAPEGGYLLILL